MNTDHPLIGSPVTIESGPVDWQVLQQDENGMADVKLSGRWWTVLKRKKPEVCVRVVREGGFSALTRHHDWVRARTAIDGAVSGDCAGRCGHWTLTLRNLPRGGPYRVQTCVGSAEDALEWR